MQIDCRNLHNWEGLRSFLQLFIDIFQSCSSQLNELIQLVRFIDAGANLKSLLGVVKLLWVVSNGF